MKTNKDNQGVINAKVEKLYYYNNTEELIRYTNTLTKDQKIKARFHLKTVISVNNFHTNNNKKRGKIDYGSKKRGRHIWISS